MNSQIFAAFRFHHLVGSAWRIAVLVGAWAVAPASATDYYWDANGAAANTGNGGASSNIIARSLQWRAGSSDGVLQAWMTDPSVAVAVFGGDLAGSVNLPYTDFLANGLRFDLTGYTLTGSRLKLIGTMPTITTAANVTATIRSEITGSNGLTKAGTGYLYLSGNNSYTGTTTVDAGTLYLSNMGGILSGTTAVVVNTGATLYLQGNDQINDAATVTIAGGSLALGVHAETVRKLTLSGNGSIASGTLTTTDGFDLESGTIGAVLNGSGSLTKSTSGKVTLNAANAYTGVTAISGGILELYQMGTTSKITLAATTAVDVTTGGTLKLSRVGEQINNSATLNVSGGTFDMGSFGETVSAVTLDNGGVIKNGKLTSSTSFDMRSGTVSGVLAGAHGLQKTTTGTVTLSNGYTSTYAGATSIEGGTLAINGALSTKLTEADRVTVAAGATLSGAGTVNRLITVSSGAILAPGDRTATFGTFTTGAEVWENDSVFTSRIGNTSTDLLNITGNLTAGSATIRLTSLGLNTSEFTTGSWLLVNTSAGITGFSGLTLDTSGLGSFSGRFTLNLADGGKDLVLNYAAVPEPGTYALWAGIAALGAVGIFRRCGRNRSGRG